MADQLINPKHAGEFLDVLQDLNWRFVPGRSPQSESDVREKADKVMAVLGQYMRAPVKRSREAAHAFMTAADMPSTITGNASVFTNTDNYDMGWEPAFMDVPLEPGRLFWEVVDLTQGLTFRRMPEGSRLQVEGLSGTKALVYCDKYGGAVGWTIEEVMGRNLSSINAKAQMFRDAYWRNKAEVHYALIGGQISGTNTTSWQSSGTNLVRDTATINAAALALASRLKDTYVGDPLSQQMVLYFNPIVWDRVLAALKGTTQEYSQAPARVLYNIRPVPTFSPYLSSSTGASVATTFALVLPGYKMQRADAMQPTPSYGYDHLSATYEQAVWAMYGACSSAAQIQFGQLA